MTSGVRMVIHLVVVVSLPLLLIGCLYGPRDPTYFLFADNRSPDRVLIRLVWIANESEGIADPVHQALPSQTTWLIEPRTGYGPDAVEIMTPECAVVMRIEPVGASGSIVIDGVHQPKLEPEVLAPSQIAETTVAPECPDR
jgi:hypothetical protein